MTFPAPLPRLRWLAPLVVGTLAHAGVLLVDDDGGVGVDFTDLPPAVAAAQPGDVIFVRTGTYTSTTIAGKRLTLIGEPDIVLPVLEIHSTGRSDPIVVSGVSARIYDVHDSTGLVLLDRVEPVGFGPARVRAGTVDDLRIHQSSLEGVGGFDVVEGDPALEVADPIQPARIEVVRSGVLGGFGFPGFDLWGGQGSDGASLQSGTLHAAMTQFTGGPGGDYLGTDAGKPGDGGDALALLGTSLARLVDPDLVLFGGAPGYNVEDDEFGQSGSQLVLGPQAALVQDPLDPALEVLGAAQFGQPTTWRAWAAPGAILDLHLGTRPQVLDDGAADVELLVKPARTFPLGIVPASGFVDFTLPPITQLGVGSIVIGQARVDLGGGDVRRSNSAVAVMVTPVP